MCGSELRTAGRPFAHLVRKRWRCDDCRRMTKLDELSMWVATVYDRGHWIIRACRACRPKRERLKWKESRSLRRLEARVVRQGFGRGLELVAVRKRLGIGSCLPESGRGTA